MTRRIDRISLDEFAAAFADEPPVLNVQQFAKVLGISPKTIYQWHEQGRFGCASRRRGKHILIWRDRALDILFNGPTWK